MGRDFHRLLHHQFRGAVVRLPNFLRDILGSSVSSPRASKAKPLLARGLLTRHFITKELQNHEAIAKTLPGFVDLRSDTD